jgi:hypothetical protein
MKPFLHQLISQSAVHKPRLKLQKATNAGVEARWAVGVPTVGVISKPTIYYVQTQHATELQELWLVFVGYVVKLQLGGA